MKYILDTCVVSEFTRPEPEPRVVAWVGAVPEDDLAVSALTLGEARFGIARMTPGRRQRELTEWLERLERQFAPRVLGVDHDVARRWAIVRAAAATRGRAIPVVDGLIAATALHHGLTIVTRNGTDFAATGAAVVDPWKHGA